MGHNQVFMIETYHKRGNHSKLNDKGRLPYFRPAQDNKTFPVPNRRKHRRPEERASESAWRQDQMNQQSTAPAKEPESNSHNNGTRPATTDQQTAPGRRNPRLVIGGLDYFELLMEQEEQ